MARVPALVAALVLAGSIPAFAQVAGSKPGGAADAGQKEPSEYARDGFYLMGSIAGVTYTGVADEARQRAATLTNQVVSATVNAAAGFNARAGYRLHPNFAVEGQYEWITGVKVDIMGGADYPDAMRLDTWTFTGNVKGYVMTGKIQPLLTVGAGLIHADVNDRMGLDLRNDDNGFAVRMGGGIDFYVTPKFLVELDLSYLLPTGGTAPFDYVSGGVGLGYRF
jgi:hypothetical protein